VPILLFAAVKSTRWPGEGVKIEPSGQPDCDEEAEMVDPFGPVDPACGTLKVGPPRTSMEVTQPPSPCPRARTVLKSPSLHSAW